MSDNEEGYGSSTFGTYFTAAGDLSYECEYRLRLKTPLVINFDERLLQNKPFKEGSFQ